MKLNILATFALFSLNLFASPVITVQQTTFANRFSTRNTVLNNQPFAIIEDFESETLGGQGINYLTGAGLFTGTGTGNGSSCIKPGGASNNACDELQVLNTATSPFGGRFNTTSNGTKWLDTNDIPTVELTFQQPLTDIFFFVMDLQDQGGRVTITAKNGGSSTYNFGTSNIPDGRLYFVRVLSEDPLTSLKLSQPQRGDGFGFDDFGTTVPEPGTYALVGSALAGIGWLRRKRTV